MTVRYAIKASLWPQLPTAPSAAPYKPPPPLKDQGTRIPCLISLYVERYDIECWTSNSLQKEGKNPYDVCTIHT